MNNWDWNLLWKISVLLWAMFLIWVTFNFFPKAQAENFENDIDKIDSVEINLIQQNEIKNEESKVEPYFALTEDEYYTVCYMVSGEAGAESYEGKKAVATCILNACELENMVPSEIRTQYQYLGWKTNLKNESEELWAEVEQAVYEVFYLGEKIDENILYFYNPEICTSSWHESMNFIMEVDGHRFFGKN